MHPAHPVTISPRVVVVDVSAHCADAALLDAAGGAMYGAYLYDAAAVFLNSAGMPCHQAYPLALTPLRACPGFSAERALGSAQPMTGLPLAAAYLERIAERCGQPQVFPDVVVAERSQYAQAYAGVMNQRLLEGFERLPAWVRQARQHRTLRVRQKPAPGGRMAPESFLVDYLAVDGSLGCFGIDMRNHVDQRISRPACASGWSMPSEILQAVEKQFSRCADIDRAQYQTFEVPVHGRLLREAFFWSAGAEHDEVLPITGSALVPGRFTVRYLTVDGRPCEMGVNVRLHGAARLSGVADWLDIVVAVEQACASYPGFDIARYRVAEVDDGVRRQRELFVPQPRLVERQAA